MSCLFRTHYKEEKMILKYIYSIGINGISPCSPGRRRFFLSNSCIEEAFGQVIQKRE